MILAWIRLIVGAVFLIGGICVELLAVISVYRFNYVLNRMQISATADTLGLGLILLGLIVFSGFSPMTLKLLLIIVLFWLSSPASSHLVAELEMMTNENAGEEYEEETR